MPDDNKVKYGLKKVHYAVQTEIITAGVPVITYGPFAPIPGAVNMKNAPVGDPAEFYADDGMYWSEDSNDGYDGDLEIALVPDSFRVNVLGDTIDENGALIENKDAKVKKIALAFEFDGDKKQTRHLLYSVNVSRPNIDGSTRTNTKTPQTETLPYKARPRSDNGNIKAKLNKGMTGYDEFFNSVYEPDNPFNTADAPEEFDKKVANQDDIEIVVTSTAIENEIKDVKFSGTSIGGLNVSVSNLTVTILKEYLSTLSKGNYVVSIELKKGNTVNVTLTVIDTTE